MLDSNRIVTWGHVFPGAATSYSYTNKNVVAVYPAAESFDVFFDDGSSVDLGYEGLKE